jgi:hypothetical protein
MNNRAGDPESLPSLGAIKEWAGQLDRNEMVGRTRSWNDCPLVHALESLQGGSWNIDGRRITNNSRSQTFDVPAPYVMLQQKVDALDGTTYPGIWLHRPITAGQLLSLVDEVIAEQALKGGDLYAEEEGQ